MYNVFIVFYYFIKSWCTYVFLRNKTTKEQYASYNLFQSTFRIPQSERTSPLLVIRKYVDFLRTLFINNNSNRSIITQNNGGIYIYDVSLSSFELRKNYMNYFSNENISGGIFKNELYFSKSKPSAALIFILSSIWMPFVFIHSIFKKDKAPFAIIFKEILETINLLNYVREFNIKKIYFFSIYEKDSNICTLILQKFGVLVNKIPSEVPLGVWNSIIIADKLCICSGYQYDEMKEFEKSMFINGTEFWGPERALENISKYKHAVETKKQTIGFYSTGSWIRKLENHIEQGFDMQKMEEEVKFAIKEFCLANPEFNLIIFLHPRERWPKYIDQTLEKYNQDFDRVKFEFSDINVRSSNSFEFADFGIAFQSTIVYERLYYGFKTILMPIGSTNFPVKTSNINTICATSKNDLFQKIASNIKLSNIQFFEKNGINHFAKFLYN